MLSRDRRPGERTGQNRSHGEHTKGCRAQEHLHQGAQPGTPVDTGRARTRNTTSPPECHSSPHIVARGTDSTNEDQS